jgi:hypothetical protein
MYVCTFSKLFGNVCCRSRVARWFVFKPKIWVNFGGPCNGRYWYILWPFGLFYGNLVYFVAIWYILRLFGYVVNLATLVAGLELDFMRTMPSKQKANDNEPLFEEDLPRDLKNDLGKPKV